MPLARQYSREFLGEAHALDLGEIGRVFDDAMADDAGDGDADRVDGRRLADDGNDFAGEDLDEFAARGVRECVDFVAFRG